MKSAHKILKKYTAVVAACLFLFSCKTTSELKEGQCLLDQNFVVNNKSEVPTADVVPYIRQQPNRYLVNINALGIRWFPYYLWLYNSIDQEKMQRIKVARDEKYDKIAVNKSKKCYNQSKEFNISKY